MNKETDLLNDLLVKLFNDVLQIEEDTLKSGPLSDLSITELHAIETIGMYAVRTMSDVAHDLDITVGSLTTAVNKLIKKDYVERKRIEEDRRVVLIKLTKKGKLAYRLHEKFHHDMINEAIEELSNEEQIVLISALEKLNNFFMSKKKVKC